MSVEPPQPATDAPEKKPVRKPFVRRSAMIRMPADAVARQGRVTTLAWNAMGDRDAVLAFLNTHDEALGGRPIDLAVADATGLAAVESVIAARAAGASPAKPLAAPGGTPDHGQAALADADTSNT